MRTRCEAEQENATHKGVKRRLIGKQKPPCETTGGRGRKKNQRKDNGRTKRKGAKGRVNSNEGQCDVEQPVDGKGRDMKDEDDTLVQDVRERIGTQNMNREERGTREMRVCGGVRRRLRGKQPPPPTAQKTGMRKQSKKSRTQTEVQGSTGQEAQRGGGQDEEKVRSKRKKGSGKERLGTNEAATQDGKESDRTTNIGQESEGPERGAAPSAVIDEDVSRAAG